MSERMAMTNKNTIDMIDLLLKDCEFIDFNGRVKKKDVNNAIEKVKKLKKKIEKHEIDIEEL